MHQCDGKMDLRVCGGLKEIKVEETRLPVFSGENEMCGEYIVYEKSWQEDEIFLLCIQD